MMDLQHTPEWGEASILPKSKSMKAIRITEFADGIDHVLPTDIPIPQPGPAEYLVKVFAAGVNYVDQLYIKGKHQNNRHSVRPPFTLGLEFSGVIVHAPPASTLGVGDNVFGACTGTYSEYVVVDSGSMIRRIPAGLTFEQAAVLAGTFPVAYKALVCQDAIKAGDTVLIHTAAGGLGVAAVQIAANMGCRVFGTASSREKCDYAEEFGAEVCLETSQENWCDRVMDLTAGRGVNFVFDPAGMVSSSLKCLAQGGQILVVGFVATQDSMEKVSMGRALMKEATIRGYLFGQSLEGSPEENERLWRALSPLLEQRKLRPMVSRCYQGLESVRAALEDHSQRKVKGKAVVVVGQATE